MAEIKVKHENVYSITSDFTIKITYPNDSQSEYKWTDPLIGNINILYTLKDNQIVFTDIKILDKKIRKTLRQIYNEKGLILSIETHVFDSLNRLLSRNKEFYQYKEYRSRVLDSAEVQTIKTIYNKNIDEIYRAYIVSSLSNRPGEEYYYYYQDRFKIISISRGSQFSPPKRMGSKTIYVSDGHISSFKNSSFEQKIGEVGVEKLIIEGRFTCF